VKEQDVANIVKLEQLQKKFNVIGKVLKNVKNKDIEHVNTKKPKKDVQEFNVLII